MKVRIHALNEVHEINSNAFVPQKINDVESKYTIGAANHQGGSIDLKKLNDDELKPVLRDLNLPIITCSKVKS